MKLIQGVTVKPLKVIADERGYLMEMMRVDDPFFQKFGQTYVSVAYPGVVKGWHYHKKQTDHFVIVILITIPPGVWHGMKGMGTEPAMLVNTPTEPYNYEKPDEFRADPHKNDIPYDWTRKDG